MEKNKICSNEHFFKLLKQFKKISCRVMLDHKDSKYYKLLCDFTFGDFINKSPLDHILDDLFRNFKANSLKSKSGITDRKSVV